MLCYASIQAHKYLVVAQVSHPYIRTKTIYVVYSHILVSSLMLDFQFRFSSRFMQVRAIPVLRKTLPLLSGVTSHRQPRQCRRPQGPKTVKGAQSDRIMYQD